ncbi:hypothetical protein J3B02_005436 [Coemansia erecta]|nr:hypothetical protein J3B02_005436 [Coemansia erecta]KAJ2855037.1 hypothetical protein FB639_006282 [Coemansia asiatica]
MAATNILALVYMVERSRLCIDFTVTFFVIHFVLVVWLYGIPTVVLWWLVMGASAGVMAFGGRAACMRREMLPIAIRNFMPDHPVEQRARDEMAVEEHELESRVHETSEPEVLFSAPNDIDDEHISHSNDMAKTSAKDNAVTKDKNSTNNDDDSDWNDNWGEEEEDADEVVSMSAQKSSDPPAQNKQAKND